MNEITRDRAEEDLLGAALDHHAAGRLERAESLYRRILARDPGHVTALHHLGVIGLQAGKVRAARKLFETVLNLAPSHADAHANLAVALKEQGKLAAAEASCRRAIELEPRMAEAHFNLANILRDLGRLDDALTAYGAAIALQPDDARAHANLGAALLQSGRAQEALDPLERALALDPGQIGARCDMAVAFRHLGRPEEALEVLERAVAAHAESLTALSLLADLLEALNRVDEAKPLIARALKLNPRHAASSLTAAKCARREGRFEEALGFLNEASLDFPTARSRAVLLGERAAIQDRLGNFRQAYALSSRSNRINAEACAGLGLDPDGFRRDIERATLCLTPSWANRWTPAASDRDGPPAFLLGFPRSGTTLLEQILKAHPLIETIEERPLFSPAERMLRSWGLSYPECLSDLDGEKLGELRQTYLDAMDAFSGPRQADRLYLDKMPLNTLKVPLIHRLFPRAKIIFVLRHPCDCCLSGVMQSYQPNGAMAGFLNMESAARFYAATMNFWRRCVEILPLDCHIVRCEDLIGDFKGEVRAILTHLGMEWDEAILHYREKAWHRLIATPSYHQVTEPIYGRARGRWRHYGEFLEPVLPILEPHVRAFGYEI